MSIVLKGYYAPAMKRDCYRVALANLLVSLKDFDTARQAFDAYPQHELVGIEGAMHLGAAPRLTRDLTDGRYEGVLYKDFPDKDTFYLFEDDTDKLFGENVYAVLEAIRAEARNGNIREHNGVVIPSGHPLYWVERNPAEGHWIVPDIDCNSYIDDGVLKWPLDNLRIVGLLDVRRNGHQEE